MACLTEVDAVPRSVVDPQLVETTTNRLGVTKVPKRQSIQSNSDSNTGATISETVDPLTKWGMPVRGLVFDDVLWFSF